ncbi:MAG: putative Fe-Mo cluster-binding protein, NifX family [Firmicutes bacterium]|nr:putative Fe-Mo cluster-binding protein, NifX family [Bacillota bacterium]MDI6706504.1 NifB/NifX family molybdenum-iron cluster-binding protein [Bacillota bacterium]
MILAIAKEGKYVSSHFGHCEGFEMVEVDGGRVLNRTAVANPGHRPGFLPEFLADKGVKAVISGGMGASAQALFNSKGIDVFTGVQGDLDSVIESYVKGELEFSDSVCHDHHYEGECHS